MAVAGLAIVATLTLLVFIFHDLFGEQVMEDLRAYAYLLQDTCENEQQAKEVLRRNEMNHDEVRFTVISADGTVLFDNDVNASEMENHADRPEVKKAFETGEGEDVRMSTTLSLSTYYVAVALQEYLAFCCVINFREPVFDFFCVCKYKHLFCIKRRKINICEYSFRFVLRKIEKAFCRFMFVVYYQKFQITEYVIFFDVIIQKFIRKTVNVFKIINDNYKTAVLDDFIKNFC